VNIKRYVSRIISNEMNIHSDPLAAQDAAKHEEALILFLDPRKISNPDERDRY